MDEGFVDDMKVEGWKLIAFFAFSWSDVLFALLFIEVLIFLYETEIDPSFTYKTLLKVRETISNKSMCGVG